MIAILWNHHKLKEVELDPNSNVPIYQQVNKLIGARTMTSITFNAKLEAYVDDEGLLVDQPKYGALFLSKETNKIIQPVAGKILFVNHDDQGETIDLSPEQIHEIRRLKRVPLYHELDELYQALVIFSE